MKKQQLKRRKSQAHAAQQEAESNAQQAFARFLRTGSGEALNAYAEATGRAESAQTLARKIGEEMEDCSASSVDDWTPHSTEQQDHDHEAHQQEVDAYVSRMAELGRRFEKVAGHPAVSATDVQRWAERQGLDVPDEPDDMVGV